MILILTEFLEKVRQFSNGWGKVWWLLNMLFRGFVILSVGGACFGDEGIDCDTSQPGCKTICFNRFMPMNPIRFWNMQLVFVFVPTVFFYAYASKFAERVKRKEVLAKEIDEEQMNLTMDDGDVSVAASQALSMRQETLTHRKHQLQKLDRKLGHFKEKERYDVFSKGADAQKQYVSAKLKTMYILHCCLKLVFEIIFLWGNYVLQVQQSQTYDFGFFIFGGTWFVPEKWICPTTSPHEDNFYAKMFWAPNGACAQQTSGVTCWVSRPNEKTFFLKYMIAMDYICIAVTCLEIVEMLFTETKKKRRKHTAWKRTVGSPGDGVNGMAAKIQAVNAFNSLKK